MKSIRSIVSLAGLCVLGCHSDYGAQRFEPAEREVPSTVAEIPEPPASATKAGQEPPAPAETEVAAVGLSAADREFVDEAIRSGLFELDASRIATTKSLSEALRDYASMMIEDHARLNRELEALASAHEMIVPISMDAQQRLSLDELHALSGPSFDARYYASQVAAHDEAIELFGRAALQCSDQDLRSFARDALPALNDHRAALNAIRIGVEPASGSGR